MFDLNKYKYCKALNMQQSVNMKTINNYCEESDSQSQYLPEGRSPHHVPKQRIHLKQRTAENQTKNKNLWSLKENILYKEFLKENPSLFLLSLRQKKIIRINILLSQYIKTRDSSQCRSHHQKMLKYHRNIANIIAYIEELQKSFYLSDEKMTDFEIQKILEPKTPPVDLREVEFPREDPVSLWEYLIKPNVDIQP